MIINKRHKRYSSILTILFFILVVTYTNVGYASNLVGITGISSFSRANENQVLIDHCGGKFELRFTFGRPEIDVMSVEFKIFDGGGKVYAGEIDRNYQNANAIGIKVGDFYSSRVLASFQKEENVVYQKFTVTVLGENGGVIEEIEDRMPELEVYLKGSKSSNIYDTLVLKNIYSEKIEITDVRSGNYIKTAKQDNISLGNGESYEIKLSPSLCPENKKEFEDNIKIEYRIGNEILQCVVSLKCSCYNSCSSGSKTKPSEETLAPLEVMQHPWFINEMRVGDAQSLAYTIKNNSDKEMPLLIGGYKAPIFRDGTVKENCGNSIGAGKSCVARFVVYPTEAGNIEQKLEVSNVSGEDINVVVKENINSALLQITPISQRSGNEIGSISSIICPDNVMITVPNNFNGSDFKSLCEKPVEVQNLNQDQDISELWQVEPSKQLNSSNMCFETDSGDLDISQKRIIGGEAGGRANATPTTSMQLKYRLENKSESRLKITSIRIPNPVSYNDPAFEIKKSCQTLEPQGICEIEITFTPEKAQYTDERAGSANRNLEVKFEECVSWLYFLDDCVNRGKRAEIPILISR